MMMMGTGTSASTRAQTDFAFTSMVFCPLISEANVNLKRSVKSTCKNGKGATVAGGRQFFAPPGGQALRAGVDDGNQTATPFESVVATKPVPAYPCFQADPQGVAP